MAKIRLGTISLKACSVSSAQYTLGANARKPINNIVVDEFAFLNLTCSVGHKFTGGIIPIGEFRGVVNGQLVDVGPTLNSGAQSPAVAKLGLFYPDETYNREIISNSLYHIQPYARVSGNNMPCFGSSGAGASASAQFHVTGAALYKVNSILPSTVDANINVDVTRSRFTPSESFRGVAPESFTISKLLVGNMLAAAAGEHLNSYSNAFKLTTQNSNPYLTGYDAYGGPIYHARTTSVVESQLLEVTTTVNFDIVLDGESGEMFAVSQGGGSGAGGQGEEIPFAENDIIVAAYEKRAEFDAKLLTHTQQFINFTLKLTDLNDILTRPAETANPNLNDTTMSIMDSWWESFTIARGDLLVKVQSPDYKADEKLRAQYEKTDKSLSFEDWVASIKNSAVVSAADVKEQGIWDETKAAASGTLSKVGDYLGKWSPSQWVTAGAGVLAVKEVNSAPQWIKYALIAGGAYFILR